MLSISILYFLLAFATIVGMVWSGMQLFRPQEDPLADRLDELVNSSVAAAGQMRRKSKGFSGRFLNFVAAIPGGDDWIQGSNRRLRQAGYRGEKALGNYIVIASAALLIS